MQLKYKQLIQNALARLKKQPNFIALAESRQFLFEEARQRFQTLKAFEASKEFYNHFLEEYQAHKGGFLAFLEQIKPHQKAHQFAILIAKLATAVDEKAPHKKVFNKEVKPRTLGVFKLWLHHWVNNCVQYKQQDNQTTGILSILEGIFRYLDQPQTYSPFLKEEERSCLAKNLLGITYDRETFDEQLFQCFQDVDIQTKLAENWACYLYFLLNQADIKILWDYTEEDIYQQEVLAKHLSEDLVNYNAMTKTRFPLNQILYGPPGTGKTYRSIRQAIAIIEDKSIEQVQQEAQILVQRRLEQYIKDQQIAFVTFHQSMGYEDFVEGIKPQVLDGQVVYQLEAGIFKQIAEQAASHPSKAHVLIIDEINRGNIASIFGELITLLEPDKRQNQAQTIRLQLMYSKELFCLTSNLYLIGTMNSADRNTERLDMALRRRFHFIELAPQTQLLSEDLEGINLRKLLDRINQRIQLLLDKEHCIGQAYFMQMGTFRELQEVFQLQIIPLLEEYFWGDYAKIGLILGEGFVEQISWNHHLFAKFSDENFSTLHKNSYQIKAFPIPKEAYLAIYQDSRD